MLKNEYRPKVSIVIPAYNASNYLAEAVDCALGQTYRNIEVIVVNDGSTDEGATGEIAKSYGDKIIYIEKKNGGSSSALNTGIAAMSGEWFSWLSHDDLYLPQKIEKQVMYLSQIPEDERESYVLFCGCEQINEHGKIIRGGNLKELSRTAYYLEGLNDNTRLIAEPTNYIFHGCGCLFHRNIFNSVGVFDEKLRIINDLDMWFRIYAEGYKIRLIDEILVQGRVHKQQVSRSIGYSYHNEEQDMYWKRSFEWLKENCPKNYTVFISYGCNAYLKTRDKEAELAFNYAKKINKQCTLRLEMKKLYYLCYASLRNFAKKLYVRFRMG